MALANPPVLTDVIGRAASLEVIWDQVAGSVLRYLIYYGSAPGTYTGVFTVPVSSLSDPAAPRYTVTGLVNNSTYWVKVSAVEVGTEEETAKSNELSAVTVAAQVISQPSNLRVAAGNGSVVLTWTSMAADGFKIEYTNDTGEPRQWNGTGALQGNSPIIVEGNINEYTLSGLQNNTGAEAPYYFRISARQGESYSASTEGVVGVPQAAFTSAMSGSYVRIAAPTGGLNLLAVPVVPKSFVPDTYNFGKFVGATQVLWKQDGVFVGRIISLPFGATKVLDPMESIVCMMPSATNKFLLGDAWANI